MRNAKKGIKKERRERGNCIYSSENKYVRCKMNLELELEKTAACIYLSTLTKLSNAK
jgi:hypothetical protein